MNSWLLNCSTVTLLIYDDSARDLALGKYYIEAGYYYSHALEGEKKKTFCFTVVS
jgi:hypothetical protein